MLRTRILIAGLATLAGVFGGTLIAQSAEAGSTFAGQCRTFHGKVTVYSCAPSVSPSGGRLARIFEDGSATYTDGSVLDAEKGTFRR